MSPLQQQTSEAPGAGTQQARLGVVFAVIAVGVSMANLDVFIVNVALPEINRDFSGASLGSLSWVINAYAVVFAALLVPAGNLADRTSPRTAYLLGVAIFTVASALCAMAPDVWFLVAARVVQAVGAALMLPSSLGLLLAAAPPERRLTSVRAWTAISGLAAALGPVAGGLLTELNWRWVFLVNVPVGIAALIFGPRVLPRVPAKNLARPDLLGAGLLTIAIAAVALGVVRSEELGWQSLGVVGPLVGSVALLAWFAARCARHPSPVLPLSLLRMPVFSAASFANILFAVAFASMLLSAVLWCQNVWEWSAMRTGLALFPGTLLAPVLALTMGPLARRLGPAPIALAGCVAFAAGIAWWHQRLEPSADYLSGMFPGMLLTGVGVGLVLPTLVGAAVAGLPPQSFSTGSGVVTMARQVGTVLGIALLVSAMGTPGTSTETLKAFDNIWMVTLAATAATALACLALGRVGRPARATAAKQ